MKPQLPTETWAVQLRSSLPHACALIFGLACVAFVYRDLPHLYFLSDAWGDMHFGKVNPLRYFVNDTYLSPDGRNYRPLWRLSMWVQHMLSGAQWYNSFITYGFIGTWLFLGSIGVFATLWALGCGALACMVGMLFFALHPAAVEAVAWSAAESYSLAGMFGAWAIALTVYGVRRDRHGLYWILPFGMALCACLSNEIGLGIPPLLILVWFCLAAPIPFQFKRKSVRAMLFPISMIILIGVYFSWRIILFGAITKYRIGPSPEPFTPIAEHSDFFKFIAGRLLWNYWPVWLEDKFSLVDPYMYIVMAALIVVALLWHVRKREVWACFALGILLAAAPYFTSHRVYIVPDDPMGPNIDSSRVLYLSVICWGLLVGCVVDAYGKTGFLSIRRTAYAVAAFVLCQYAVNTRLNLKVWLDASNRVRRFVETLPKCLPNPPLDKPIALVGLEPFLVEQEVPGMYTNKAFTFQVATGFMVQYIYKNEEVTAVQDPANPTPGQPVITIDKDGTALCR